MPEAETIEVSDSWKKRFEILEKMRADNGFKDFFHYDKLSPRDNFKARFNIWAFCFRQFYYFAKKMWLKGAFLFGAGILLNVVFSILESALGTTFPMFVFHVPSHLVCAMFANYDYYRFCTKQEKMWGGFPKLFSSRIGAIGFLIAALLLLIIVTPVPYSGSSISECPRLTKYSPSEIEERKLVANTHRGVLAEYLIKTSAVIKESWSWAGSIPAKPVKIYTSISEDGTILCASIEESSGDELFDQSVLVAMAKVKQVEPPPPEIARLVQESLLTLYGE